MTSAIDLNPNHLDIVERILAEHVPGCEVRAFGSRAAWTARDYSDVDLAVVGDGPLHWRTLSRLREAFEESRLPMRVDVLDWHAISEGFREAIKSDCVVVQEAVTSADWQPMTLGECAVLVRDTVSPVAVGEVPYLGLEHIGEGTLSLVGAGAASDVTSAKSRFKSDDILFGKLRPYFRKVARPRFGGICSTDIWVVRPAEGVDAGYLFYVMASEAFVDAATRGSEGTKMPRAKWEFVSRFEFLLPPLEEQRAIARVLGALDDRIELNRRKSETLEEMARALFRSWFVDFDPVRAKTEGRPSGLPPGLDALFPASFEESELGEIPAGWGVKSIYASADVIYGAPFSSKLFNENGQGLPLIRIRDLRSGAPQVFTEEVLSGSRVVQPGRIVVGMDGEFRAYLWQGAPAYLNQRVCEFVEREPASRAFLLYGLEDLLREQELTKSATTVIHLLKRDINGFRLVSPPAELHERFRALTDPLLELCVSTAEDARVLSALRDALLPRLLSGELRARAA